MAIELTAEQLAVLSASLQVAGARRAPLDRRRIPRLDVRASVSIALVTDGESGPAFAIRIRDLSSRGVALLHPKPMTLGRQFVLTLERAGGPPVQILCTIIHSRAGKGRLHTIGAEFTCALSALPVAPAFEPSQIGRIKCSVLD